MANKTLREAKWFWEDYNGVAWNNVAVANSGKEGLGSYVYLKDKKKPKSLFYHYQVTGIDANDYLLDSVKFVLIIREFKENENYFPTLKVFTGDNNAPYKKSPIKTVTTHKKLKNEYWYDNYTLEYDLTGVSISDLKNIIVEVDWKNSKVNSKSTISVNRGRLEVNYSPNAPSWRIYDYVPTDYCEDGEEIRWKISAKNGGYKGNGEVQLDLPKGVQLVSSNGDGSFNNTTKKWTFTGDRNEQKSRYFTLRFNVVGEQNLIAYNNLYPTNATLYRDINVGKKIEPPKPIVQDQIYYTFYQTFAKEERQYFDVQINGMQQNHESGTSCYTIETSDNVVLYTPLSYPNVYVLNESDDRFYGENGVNSTRFCVTGDETDDFEGHLRFFFYATGGDTGTVTITDDNNFVTTGTFPILPPRKNIFLAEPSISRDTTYVQNSVNVGAEDVWTIRAKAHRHNFFDERKDLMEIGIEEQIAYIGVIPLSRCHKADVTATSKNSLIENRYLNRAYYGKKGDYSEDIKMTLRLAWYDVATLQGLCEMDKPIPIDTIPNRADGDPLNHRGWAEIYEVSNIKKINDMLYECDVGVTYLTHDILTKFTIAEAQKITEANIKFYLSLIHNYNDDILDLFSLNYYEFWTTLEDEFGDKTGSYSIEPNTSLIMNKDLNKYSTYDIIYRNTLPQLMSEDYDGNWEMALRVLNKTDLTTLFEHSYSNFKHYDFDAQLTVNTADANTMYLNGNDYETLNFESIELGYDSLASSLEDRRLGTHFNRLETIIVDSLSDKFQAFLLDNDYNGLKNKAVKVEINDNLGFKDSFNIMTDTWGRVIFDLGSYPNGNYDINLTFEEDDNYKGCELYVDMVVDFDYVTYHFEHPTNATVLALDYPYQVRLLDSSNQGVSSIMLHYSFKDATSNTYGYERTVTTDSNGYVNIPIDWTNGTKNLRVLFKGFEDDGTIYQPVQFEDTININLTGETLRIESDNLGLMQGDAKDFNVIVKDKHSVPLANIPLNIAFSNKNVSSVYEVTTNEYGVASVPINLDGGSWTATTHFKGNSTYNPTIQENIINVYMVEKSDTNITSINTSINENNVINGTQGYYTIFLNDKNGNPIKYEPVSISVDSLENVNYIDVVIKTDEMGRIEVPFLTHSENVKITSEYKGNSQYKATTLEETVMFETVTGKSDVTFSINTFGEIVIQLGNTTPIEIDEDNIVERCILNYPNDDSNSFDNIVYYKTADRGTYNVTVLYKGSADYYAKATTLSYTKNTTGKVSIYTFTALMGDEFFTAPTLIYKKFVDGSMITPYPNIGDALHMKMVYDVEMPMESLYVDFFKDGNVQYSIQTIPHYFVEDGVKKTYFEFDCIPLRLGSGVSFQNRFQFGIRYSSSNFIYDDTDYVSIQCRTIQKTNPTITQTGFGNLGQTQQEIDVLVSDDNAESQTRTSDYITMRLFNTATMEEYYFNTPMIDNVTPSHLSFLLGLGTWNMDIISFGTDEYSGALYQTSATLTQDSMYIVDSNFFYNQENWNKVGTCSSTLVISNDEISVNDYSSSCYFLSREFTQASIYELDFKVIKTNNSTWGFVISLGNTESESYYLEIRPSNIQVKRDGSTIETVTLSTQITTNDKLTIDRNMNTYSIKVNGETVYRTTRYFSNNLGLKLNNMKVKGIQLGVNPVDEITPSVDEYDGTVFGSNLHLDVRDDHLNIIDYGMLPSGAIGTGKVIVNDVPLPVDDLILQMEIKYNNTRFDRLENLQGQMQMRVYEDISTTDAVQEYSKVLCSPMVVPNVQTIFTRHSEEGILYYIKDPKQDNDVKPYYLCNAYNQYKGGVQIVSETGVQLFDLDNAYSPVFVGNNLVRAEFHRRSGYIKLSRWSEDGNEWYVANVLKLKNNPQLSLNEYNDDYAEVQFGNTVWKFYRGRPFIVVNHEQDDFRVLNLVDRVYCETFENDRSMGLIEEHDAMTSTFTPMLSIQQFKRELHIGEDIKIDNFELFDVDSNYNLSEHDWDSLIQFDFLDTVEVDGKTYIELISTTGSCAVVFPSNASYVERVGSTFSLLIGDVIAPPIGSPVIVKARGYDDRGCVPVRDGIQYGIWEQVKTVDWEDFINNPTLTFRNCPSEVKYLDFVIIPTDFTTIKISDLMYYEGDSVINHQEDTSLVNAEKVEVLFNETYYANFYNENDKVGLSIIRPSQHKLTLRTIYGDKETVFVPYMKKATDYDSPNQIFLEYLNAKRQIIDIDWDD